ncbi:lytic transglycosylase domain-containing protein [Bradyrhizobium sp. IC3069]|uniref:lytic transglycosylase domain-containing protein n=1 Tax=Bradyrhizobium TaxID=374 RepID=UPI000D64DCFC|nr:MULTISPECIES: lytic transglycosylase domain-containing protein [unclassified Bradyrhizobium]MCA1361985.1 lytic transglycosylase domain-containing protein [Bradyrhizobium sp. IC4059]MCA1388378.1 lytic transglycosylase domain-containing protein [Bradyrhizobium sp. IC3123]MCA1520758.1 lytic transglycosylase domain-containing protein [Bradyrhizobium sp. IC3069]PWE78541.1 lytic transglycosylase [Bradyrhizobium sp. SUTN9-2]UWU88267.1 lytic transglycosylase domain-containing protein [Bradyrhizobiu
MNQCLRSLACVVAVAAMALLPTELAAKSSQKSSAPKKTHEAKAGKHRHASAGKARHGKHAEAKRKSKKAVEEPAAKPPLTGDLAALKDAIDLTRKGKTEDASAARDRITDPAGQKLADWFMLRHPDSTANFKRYAAFLAANPGWPSSALLRRRAEARLWQEKADAAIVHKFTMDRPTSAKGKFALARVLLAEGETDRAARLVRETWRAEELSERSEEDSYAAFGDLLSADDHRARMDKRLGAKDYAGARRAAKRLGEDALAIVKACAAVTGKASKAKDLLEDVAAEERRDLGYVLCRAQWHLQNDRIDDAAEVILAAKPDMMAAQDTDAWWRERRMLARKLLDQGKARIAYDVVHTAAVPEKEVYRVDYHFMCGWIALRYLDDPKTAMVHFASIDAGSSNPIALSRAHYWRGRAAEAMGAAADARMSYRAAARYHTAYYGQLARARLGLDGIELRPPSPVLASADAQLADERVRAADMLYGIGERDMVFYYAEDFAKESTDVAALEALGELAGRRNDARVMLEVGKTALARGLALDHYAFPTIGIPEHKQVAPAIETSVIYSVARTESSFEQRDKSHANAVGLMQVTPEAGRDTAKRFGLTYDWDRMVSDPVYNTQMGAAELSALFSEYRGNQIMTFAGYNAGRGRVREWVQKRGDPRDPNVDPVDWVERIPLSETRNYVQRVMENVLVYRARFEGSSMIAGKSDQRVVTHEASATEPAAAAAPIP